MGTRVTYMNIPAARPPQDESFEERRVADYLHAYTKTGRAPAPCPPQPTDPTQRVALGLPPLWEPYVEVEGAVNGIAPTPSVAAPLDFAAQAFQPVKTQEYGADSTFFNIVAQPEYAGHSPEELRVEAYRLGKKFADVPAAPPEPAPSSSLALGLQRPALLTSISLTLSSSAQTESLQSINSVPPYDRHSFEELRLAYARAGRTLTSVEILAQNAVLRIGVP